MTNYLLRREMHTCVILTNLLVRRRVTLFITLRMKGTCNVQ